MKRNNQRAGQGNKSDWNSKVWWKKYNKHRGQFLLLIQMPKNTFWLKHLKIPWSAGPVSVKTLPSFRSFPFLINNLHLFNLKAAFVRSIYILRHSWFPVVSPEKHISVSISSYWISYNYFKLFSQADIWFNICWPGDFINKWHCLTWWTRRCWGFGVASNQIKPGKREERKNS